MFLWSLHSSVQAFDLHIKAVKVKSKVNFVADKKKPMLDSGSGFGYNQLVYKAYPVNFPIK